VNAASATAVSSTAQAGGAKRRGSGAVLIYTAALSGGPVTA
jgi:hypothetical protein